MVFPAGPIQRNTSKATILNNPVRRTPTTKSVKERIDVIYLMYTTRQVPIVLLLLADQHPTGSVLDTNDTERIVSIA
jgi:hypothetical protein